MNEYFTIIISASTAFVISYISTSLFGKPRDFKELIDDIRSNVNVINMKIDVMKETIADLTSQERENTKTLHVRINKLSEQVGHLEGQLEARDK